MIVGNARKGSIRPILVKLPKALARIVQLVNINRLTGKYLVKIARLENINLPVGKRIA